MRVPPIRKKVLVCIYATQYCVLADFFPTLSLIPPCLLVFSISNIFFSVERRRWRRFSDAGGQNGFHQSLMMKPPAPRIHRLRFSVWLKVPEKARKANSRENGQKPQLQKLKNIEDELDFEAADGKKIRKGGKKRTKREILRPSNIFWEE